ncbi:tRNA dihydrouridine synthase DusB [bacterium]|nr:tRNA dihydrouridine synthase DusB [bacterium]
MPLRKPVRLDPRIPWFAEVRHLLSPMAGVTDRPFRTICRDHGADMGFCEFTSASGLYHENEQTWALIDTEGEPGRVGIQIFGDDPGAMGAATELLVARGRRMDVLDLNFGCPAKKVVKKCGGSALLADVPRLERIVRAVVAAAGPVPVSAKFRTGWDETSLNYEEVGRLLEELGCVWVTLHGRTRNQKYKGEANWDTIARLVEALEIPVVGNGDVVDGASCRAMVAHTRCHGVMVARAAIGNPWIFGQMTAAEGGRPWAAPSFDEICETMARHIRLEVAQRGERTGSLVVRKHLARCFRGYPGAAALRRRLFAEESSAGMIAVLDDTRRAGDPRRLPDHEPEERAS